MIVLANILQVDSTVYRLGLLSLHRTFPFLDKDSTGRTADGGMHRELIGVFRNYQALFGVNMSSVNYVSLIDDLTKPLPFRTVEIRYGSIVIAPSFKAYFGSIEDDIDFIDTDGIRWKGLAISFISNAPFKTP